MENDKLTRQLAELTKLTAQQVSPIQVFLRGLIAGVGTAIGATLIAGLILAVLGEVLRRSELPVLNIVLDQLADPDSAD